MKYRLNETATVYSATSSTSPAIATLQTGDEIEVGEASKNGGEEWHKVTLPDGKTGYVSARTKGSRVGSKAKSAPPPIIEQYQNDQLRLKQKREMRRNGWCLLAIGFLLGGFLPVLFGKKLGEASPVGLIWTILALFCGACNVVGIALLIGAALMKTKR